MSLSVKITDLYDLLAPKLGKDEARLLVDFVETKTKETIEEKTKDLVTKDYLDAKIAESKTEIIKWMFIFWIGQLAATISIIPLFIKK